MTTFFEVVHRSNADIFVMENVAQLLKLDEYSIYMLLCHREGKQHTLLQSLNTYYHC